MLDVTEENYEREANYIVWLCLKMKESSLPPLILTDSSHNTLIDIINKDW